VAQRAPHGFTRLEDVIAPDELAAIVGGYAQMAGFADPLSGGSTGQEELSARRSRPPA
jgi:hypothetical protein